MKIIRTLLIIAGWLAVPSTEVVATTNTYNFSGVTFAAGGLPDNMPFYGTFSYDDSVPGVTTPYGTGAEIVFGNAYSALTLTIGGETVSETVPGTIAMFNAVGNGLDNSLFTYDALINQTPNASIGAFDTYGLTPNFIYLELNNSTDSAFSGTDLPPTLDLSSFGEAFIGINYGPFGVGNSGMALNITSLEPAPEPETGWLMLCGLGVIIIVRTWKIMVVTWPNKSLQPTATARSV